MVNGRGESMAQNDYFSDKNVLITGATGLVGPYVVNALLEKGVQNAVCIVRDRVPDSIFFTEGAAKKCVIVGGELQDYFLLERVINEYEITNVIHLGAQAIVGTANRSPLATFESNIKGTWNVLEACRQLGVKRTVVASSDKAYGAHEKLPYKEDFCLNGFTPYEASKSCADLLARAYAKTYRLPVAVTRCGNIYGGGDLNWNRIIPGTIKAVLNNESPIIRSDGTPIRDYIYVLDVVAAYLAAAEQLDKEEVAGEAFNFGTETPVSVLVLAKKIIAASGKGIEPVILNEAKNELQEQYLDWAKAKKVLGW
ncbi:TPA: NAD-dependent epimerase/dehydratase family protein, partial [Candidatus Micrarchaeota archaeon]|nr:NAD-dependent epimerase/dehydratase family protein [Candidatus Micrarchaeota archaeon]